MLRFTLLAIPSVFSFELMLSSAGVLREPILYMSLYFKENRQAYYELLNRVRTEGDWETWVEFFLTGIREASKQAAETAREILKMIADDRKRIESLRRPAASALEVYQHMCRAPIISIPTLSRKLGLTAPTVAKSLEHMIRLGILREGTGRRRGRLFVYEKYVEVLNRGAGRLIASGLS